MSLKDNVLLESLPADEKERLTARLPLASYPPDTLLMADGSPSDHALLITSGSVDIHTDELKLTTLGPGDVVGMIGLIDGGARTADVRTSSEGCTAHVLDRTTWEEMCAEEPHSPLLTMLMNYLRYHKGLLKQHNEVLLDETRMKLKVERRRIQSAQFFVQMVLGLIVFTFALGYLMEMAQNNEPTYISLGVISAYGLWSLLYVRMSGLSLADFGITLKGIAPAMILSLKATVLFCLAMFAAKWLMVSMAPETFGSEIIDWYHPKEGSVALPIILAIYSFHAVVQEFIARACIQGGLQQFIIGRRAAWTAIVLATLLFSSFHLMLDLKFAFLTIIPGLFWGWLFQRTNNLWAVAFSHVVIGVIAVFMLQLVS